MRRKLRKKDVSKIPTPLARTLYELRINANLTQQAVADILDISRSAYSYYELGRTSPSLNKLNQLAILYGVSISIFL